MSEVYVYKGRRIKTEDGKDSRFYVDSKGRVYDDGSRMVRKVGRLTKKGLKVDAKYALKYGDRLKEITTNKKPNQANNS